MKELDMQLLKKVGAKLLKRKHTIAVAESVSAGLLQHSFSKIPDAAKFFQGGITAYNLGQKARHLRVEPLHALTVNCVSQQVANQMATAVSSLFSSDWGIGITGYATPTPEGEGKLFSYYAICFKGKLLKKGKIKGNSAKPELVQHQYLLTIFRTLHSLLPN